MLFETTVSIAVVVCVLLLIGGSLWYRRHNAPRERPKITWVNDTVFDIPTDAQKQAVERAVDMGMESPGYNSAEEAPSSGSDGYGTPEEITY